MYAIRSYYALDLGTVEAADVNATVTYLDASGNPATTTIAALQAGLAITIPANSTYAPEFVITANDDAIFEKSESLTMSVALAAGETDATLSTTANAATGTIYDEDSNDPTEPDPSVGDELGDRITSYNVCYTKLLRLFLSFQN